MPACRVYTFDEMRTLLRLQDKRPRHLYFWDRLVPYLHPREYTSQEVNDYANYRGIDKVLPEEPRLIYIGSEFSEAKDIPGVRCLRSPRLVKPYVAGIVHLSVNALEKASQEFLEALCKHVYDYNYVVHRYRPYQQTRCVYLCTRFGEREYAQQVQLYLNRHYPDTVQLEDQTHTLSHLIR